jgi:branched-chain amino acid transport system substrate-binding protein
LFQRSDIVTRFDRLKGGIMKKRIVKRRTAWITALAVALSAALLFTACAPGPPEEEKKVVRVGFIVPLTGPPSNIMQVAVRNAFAYLEYFEEAEVPGLALSPGVAVEIAWGDSGFMAEKVLSIYERIRNDVVIFYVPTGLAKVIKARLERDGMAAICMNYDEAMMYPPGPLFSIWPTESEKFAVLCDWIMENWEEERPPRLCMIGADSPSGRAAEVMGPPYARSVGIEMLPFESAPYMCLDASPQLLRIRDREADFVYMPGGTDVYAPPIMKDAARLGLLDTIRFGGHGNGQSQAMLSLGPSVDGYFSPRCTPWYEEVPICVDLFTDPSGDSAGQLVATTVLIKAISIAIDNVGYENLDGRAVKEAMYSIKDFDPHGTGRAVSYTPEDHRGSPMVRMYEIWAGEVVPVTEWRQAPMLVPGE